MAVKEFKVMLVVPEDEDVVDAQMAPPKLVAVGVVRVTELKVMVGEEQEA